MGAKQRLREWLEVNEISLREFGREIDASPSFLGSDGNVGSDKLEKIYKAYPEIDIIHIITGEQSRINNLDNSINLGVQNLRQKIAPKVAPNVAPNSEKVTDKMLSEAFDGAIERGIRKFQLRTDRNVEAQDIPLYDIEAAAGLVPLFTGDVVAEPEDYIHIPHLPKCDGAVHVTGDSMYPLLKSGDIVLYKAIEDIQNDIFFGEMYLLSLDVAGDEYVTVKFIKRSEKEGFVTLVSQNKHHEPKEVKKSKIRALALVKASIRINSMN